MITLFVAAFVAAPLAGPPDVASPRPNVILMMADDQGYGDVGCFGHPTLRTPHLDAMAMNGIRFTRFYAAAPVCSPTRGSCLTGRHPWRYGITGANAGHLPRGEPNLAALLRERGYRTGHFGKWHLGTLTRDEIDSNRGGREKHDAHYAPPWLRGFDECFSTEAKVPTYDPMITPPRERGGVAKSLTPGEPYGTAFWTGPGRKATGDLSGDASALIMNRALEFIGRASADGPFFCVIWFHAPHLPVLAGDEHRAPYAGEPDHAAHYYGCIAALDEQVGRLRATLRKLGVADDTMVWYCSDNGPEHNAKGKPGSKGPLRGAKRSLYEGGVRVPGIVEWPGGATGGRVADAPCGTIDILPTVLDVLDVHPTAIVDALDGASILPLLRGAAWQRSRPMPFLHGGARAVVTSRWKLIRPKRQSPWELYDLLNDAAEERDIIETERETADDLIDWITAFEAQLPIR